MELVRLVPACVLALAAWGMAWAEQRFAGMRPR